MGSSTTDQDKPSARLTQTHEVSMQTHEVSMHSHEVMPADGDSLCR